MHTCTNASPFLFALAFLCAVLFPPIPPPPPPLFFATLCRIHCKKLRRLSYYISEASYGVGNPLKLRESDGSSRHCAGASWSGEGGDKEFSSPRSSLRRHYRVSPSSGVLASHLPLVQWAIAVEEEAVASNLGCATGVKFLRTYQFERTKRGTILLGGLAKVLSGLE